MKTERIVSWRVHKFWISKVFFERQTYCNIKKSHFILGNVLLFLTEELRQALKIQIYKNYVFMVDRVGCGGNRFNFVCLFFVFLVLIWLFEFTSKGTTVSFHKMLFGISVTASILIQKSSSFVFIEEFLCLKHLLIFQDWFYRRIQMMLAFGVVVRANTMTAIDSSYFLLKVEWGEPVPRGW